MKCRRSKKIKILAGIIVFMTLIVFLVPVRSIIESKIRQNLQTNGVDVSTLHLESVGLYHASLRDIRIGKDAPIVLNSLDVSYNPYDVLTGRFEDIALHDLNIDVRQDAKGVWSVSGIQSSGGGALVIPQTIEAIDSLPLKQFSIRNGLLKVSGMAFDFAVPIDIVWDGVARKFDVTSNQIEGQINGQKLSLADAKISLQFQNKDKKWAGTWAIESIHIPDVSTTAMKGTLLLEGNVMAFSGVAEDKTAQAKGSVFLKVPLDGTGQVRARLRDVLFPYAGGQIKIQGGEFALDGKSKIRLDADVQNVALEDVLKQIIGQDIEASGQISGKVPVIINPADGRITLGRGQLAALKNGLVSVPATLIPGEGAQLDLTRQVLENFEYEGLSIEVKEEEKGNIAFILNVSGKNPKVYDGRAVKLNVRLGGDVIEFLQSNFGLMTQPQSILTQETK